MQDQQGSMAAFAYIELVLPTRRAAGHRPLKEVSDDPCSTSLCPGNLTISAKRVQTLTLLNYLKTPSFTFFTFTILWIKNKCLHRKTTNIR